MADSQPTPRIEVVEDSRYHDHRGPDGHPERPERLVAIGEALDPFRSQLEFATPRAAEPYEILLAHDKRMLDALATTR